MAELPPLTGPQALRLLREVVAEHGEDHVGGDFYVADGWPCCPVGHVLHRHGVPVAELAEYEYVAAADLPSGWMDADARALMETAQDVADVGCWWGTVLDRVEERAVLRGIRVT